MESKIKVSYAITVKDEIEEIKKLVSFLLLNKRGQDEIVILFDEKNGTEDVSQFIESHAWDCNIHRGDFVGHFADWKNLLTSYCTGDYIVNIDADEIPNNQLIFNLPAVMSYNPEVDIFCLPRVNTVEGLTPQHIAKWGWRVDERGWVNWPDFQMRVYRNTPDIRWKGRVHEVLEGYKKITTLPLQEEFALYHPKTIDRQERQNNYYDTL